MSLSSVSQTLSAVGTSAVLHVRPFQPITYAVDFSADFDGRLFLEYSDNAGASWTIQRQWAVGEITDVSTTEISTPAPGLWRFRVTLGTEETLTGTAGITLSERATVVEEWRNNDGDILLRVKQDSVEILPGISALSVTEGGVMTLGTSVVRASQKRIHTVGAKVGATAGWAVNAGDNKALLATCPQSQTASTLVVPISGLKVGDTITAFHLVGQIDSAGNAVTLDADLRKLTVAVAGHSDASVGAMTQVSVTADTALSSANTTKGSLTEVVGADETFYVLLTATTGATTDIEIQGVAVVVTES